MNRLDALKYFVAASQAMSFKMTAQQFSVSPQVITRVMGELEKELGEPLFKRNTRAISLTDFGERFLPQAIAFLKEEERLFASGNDDEEPAGLVRITLPPSTYGDKILFELLTALEPYPHIDIEWRESFDTFKAVEDRIDIGIRFSRQPEEHWVVKKIGMMNEPIVAAPKLIARTGLPKDIFDLLENFPVGNVINPQTGKAWNWTIGEQSLPVPNPTVATLTSKSLLQAVLAGRVFAPIMLKDCEPYLQNGSLEAVFNNEESESWGIYLYRPYQVITPKRVLVVFELLEKILMGEK